MKRFLIIAACLALALTAPGYGMRAALAAEEGPAPKDQGTDEGKRPPSQDTPDAKKDDSKGGEDGGGKKQSGDVFGGRFNGDPIFIHLAPLILPVITDQGAEQIVTLQLALEITDFDVGDTIHTDMPIIRDALMRALYGGLSSGSVRNGKLVDVVKVKAKTLAAMNEVLGANKVRDVLVEGVSQRVL